MMQDLMTFRLTFYVWKQSSASILLSLYDDNQCVLLLMGLQLFLLWC